MSVESIKYGDICDKCAHGDYCDMATFGGHNPKITACCKFTERHQTHADRIRAMTDDELAEVLCLISGGQGPVSSADGRDWLDWLKQEAE